MAVENFELNGQLPLSRLADFVFRPANQSTARITVSEKLSAKIARSHQFLNQLIEKGVPIYGVTTGFGDSSHRYVQGQHGEELQVNLIRYLSCGLGRTVPLEATRAMVLIRLNSLSQGLSGVSPALIEHLSRLLKHDILPVVPCEGSLGASGDLVPLAYLGQVVQGYGQVFFRGGVTTAEQAYQQAGLKPYVLKPKEGLAIVNGTSTMAGMTLYNLRLTQFLIELSETATSWQCLVLNGRTEAFGKLVNEVAKTNPGQALSASRILAMISAEGHAPVRGQDVGVRENFTADHIQDPYSLRCVPQILGPIRDALVNSLKYLEHEVNGVTDNPLISDDGHLELGGNFYGGYLCQAMDLTKINLAHLVDLADRQVLMLVSDKFNRGLPSNLIDTRSLTPDQYHLHHGLKGVHQTVGALTSEIIQRSIPSGIFSRSSESHNQDKVSLGMSAAMSCLEMLNGAYKIMAMQLMCLAQAVDLRGIKLKGSESRAVYDAVRGHSAFVDRDRGLGSEIESLAQGLKESALRGRI